MGEVSVSKFGELRREWVLLLGCTLGVAVGPAALPFYTAGIFVNSLNGEFNWSLSQISIGSLVATLTVALCAPFVGSAVDRFGVRLAAGFGLTFLSLGFMALGSMSGGFEYYIVILILMAAFGLSSSPISFTRAINEKFHAARGLALGITLSGTGITAYFAPPIIAAIIADHGWRTGYFTMAAIVAIFIPIVLLLVRTSKVSHAAPHEIFSTPSNTLATPHLSWGVIFRTPIFLRLFAAFFVLALGISGFVLHLVPMLSGFGMPPLEAAGIQAILGISVVAGRLIIGFLVDEFFAPRVAAVSLCITLGGLISLAIVGPDVATFAAFAIGFALGAEVDLIGYLTMRYFGLAMYGRLYGALYGAFIVGTGLSPLVIARLQMVGDDYTLAIWVCASFVATAIGLLATAPRFPNAPLVSV